MTRFEKYITEKARSQPPLSREERDVCLVESLNRHIGALEGRLAYLTKTVEEQRGVIEELGGVARLLENLIARGDPVVPDGCAVDFWVDLIARSERLSERHEWFVGRVREMRKAQRAPSGWVRSGARKAAERAVDKVYQDARGRGA
jgi:hypothetical protein